MIASPQRFIEPFSKILKAIGDLRMALGFCGAQPCLSAIANGLLDLQMQLTVPAASAHALLETVEKRISEFSESFLNVENFCTSEKTSELFFEISQQFIDILANLKTTVGTNTFSQQMAAVPAVPAAKKEESYAPTEYNETPRETPREEKSSATPKRERKYRAPAQHDKPPVIYIEPQPSTLRRLWIKIGASSLSISLLIHSLLLLCAGLVVTTIYNAQTVTENLDTFATGAGGGREGKDVSFERRVKLKRPVPQRPSSLTKITARTASSVTLPDIPNLDRLLIKQSGEIGKISKGSGTGAGGGIGDGIGPGRGGRNMVGMFKPQFVMGVKIHSGNGRVAVYLDKSGSMVPFLDGVKREIRSKFPDADIF
jgi:hypothetical protein